MDYRARQFKVAELLAKHRVDGILVTHLPNVRYLCGFTGSAGALLLTHREGIFATDGRYTEQAEEEIQGVKVVIGKFSALSTLAKIVAKKRLKTLALEADHLTLSSRKILKSMLPATIRLKEIGDWIERLRSIKEPAEIDLMRKAAVTGAGLFSTATKAIRVGVEETRVAAEMEYAAREAGADAMSFETIVASGLRSALPHGRASRARIPARGFVVLDFGVILAGYCSDRTRTVHIGKPNPKMRHLYDAVLESQLAGISAVRAGTTAADVDEACRSVLRRARLDRYFTHSTGHGVGLEIHEFPRLARNQTEVLVSGMVVTVEPGVYIPGQGGVRIEDTVVVTERGCEILAPSNKDLIQL